MGVFAHGVAAVGAQESIHDRTRTSQRRIAMATALRSSIPSRVRGWRPCVAMARATTQRSCGCTRLLLSEARYQVRRRTAALAHPSGRDLDDLAVQAADDALVAILRKLDRFRGDALFSTWARRFAELEVPGKIRRRLGHARETPTESETLQLRPARARMRSQSCEAADLADRLGELIVHELTSHQREVLVALAIDGVDPKDLASPPRLDPGGSLQDASRRAAQAQARARRPGTEPSSWLAALEVVGGARGGETPRATDAALCRGVGSQRLTPRGANELTRPRAASARARSGHADAARVASQRSR